jgi:hypothetical protein
MKAIETGMYGYWRLWQTRASSGLFRARLQKEFSVTHCNANCTALLESVQVVQRPTVARIRKSRMQNYTMQLCQAVHKGK